MYYYLRKCKLLKIKKVYGVHDEGSQISKKLSILTEEWLSKNVD